ncbi:hypothetical protein ACFCYH_38660, partial [Streptomyces sp. NPDC056400]
MPRGENGIRAIEEERAASLPVRIAGRVRREPADVLVALEGAEYAAVRGARAYARPAGAGVTSDEATTPPCSSPPPDRAPGRGPSGGSARHGCVPPPCPRALRNRRSPVAVG